MKSNRRFRPSKLLISNSIALFLVFAATLTATAADPPNILFILADDQRADAIAAYGNPNIQTPNIDTLVRRGYNFRQNYCMGSMHGAVCIPSRAMIMSGRSLYHVPTDLAHTETMPQRFGANGYQTFGTGKWHNGKESFRRSFQQGRNIFFGGMSNHLKIPTTQMNPDRTLSETKIAKGFSSELFADAAVDFLNNAKRDAPFFLYLSFTAPHDPRQPPEPYRQAYDAAKPPLPPNFLPQHPFNNGWLVGRDENLAPWPRTPQVIRAQLAEYYAMITHMDAQIGRVLRALDATGQADNTIIVYAADHGLAIGSHGLLGKQSVYEHSMGAPLIFVGPTIDPGQSRAFTYLFDIYPTLCDLTAIDKPEGIDGRSLQPILNRKQQSVRDTIYLTYEDSQRALREGPWKLIRYPRINYTQLFNIDQDPYELTNLADKPQHAERVDRIMERLKEMAHKNNDTIPLSTNNPAPFHIDLTNTPRKPDKHQPQWIIQKYFDPAPTIP